MKTIAQFILLTILFAGCKKKKNSDYTIWEHINGIYTGNIYTQTQGFDSLYHVVRTYDTIFNTSSILKFDEESNIGEFGYYKNIRKIYITDEEILLCDSYNSLKSGYKVWIYPKEEKIIFNSYNYTQGGPNSIESMGEFYKN